MLEFIYSRLSLQSVMWLVVLFPLAGSIVSGAFALCTASSGGARLKPPAALLGVASSLGSLAFAVILFFTLTGFEVGSPAAITGPLFRWLSVGDLIVDVGLKVDQLSLVFVLTTCVVSSFVQIYSIGSMYSDDGFLRFQSLTQFMLFCSLLFVMAENMFLMFIALEGMSVAAAALIGHRLDDRSSRTRVAGAVAMSAIGDACLIAAAFLIFGAMSASGADPEFGLFGFETMEQHAAYLLPVSTKLAILVLLAAMAKSAQLPMNLWMSGSARAPLPSQALIGSVTMLAAGAYLVLRLNFIFALSPAAMSATAIVGAVGAVAAASMALAETDLRRILAYSAISQYGLIYMALGSGAFAGAAFHVVTHALFNSLLVMAAGSAIAQAGGCADIREMGGLKRRMPITGWAFVVAAAALAGLAPTSGFFSLQAILGEIFGRGNIWIWIAGFAACGVSSFYIFRAAGSVFFGDTRMPLKSYKRVSEPGISMVVPMMLMMSIVAAAGVIGLPSCLGGDFAIGRWLGDLIPARISRFPDMSCGTWIVLAAVTFLWSAHFAILGWLIYSQKRDWPARISRRIKPVVTLVSRRYYLPELYSVLVIGPIGWIARTIVDSGLDRTVVGGIIVGGAGRAVGLIGSLAQAMQTGTLHHYLLYFLIGAIAIIALVAL